MSGWTIEDDEQAVMHMMDLRSERAARGMTRMDLAAALKLYPDTIREWENHKRYPRPKYYNIVAEFFGWPKYCLRAEEAAKRNVQGYSDFGGGHLQDECSGGGTHAECVCGR